MWATEITKAMKRIILTLLLILPILSKAQNTIDNYYEQAYQELSTMLKDTAESSFKRAVFITENAFLDNQLSYETFKDQISELKVLAKNVESSNGLEYQGKDRKDVLKYWAAYAVLKDSLQFDIRQGKDIYRLATTPFSYDFEDFFGEKDWTKMFVTKLLATHKGNCHSLPFLYKILVEELGGEAHLAMSPNHTYIKQWTEETGWFNTELTSGQFPLDAWIMASGYIKLEAVQNRLYMEALDSQKSIAVTLVDLAQGYQKKTGQSANFDFIHRCLDTALKYYPNYAHARILKAETLKAQYTQGMDEYEIQSPTDFLEFPQGRELYQEMQSEYQQVYHLGYRKMPREMYLNWLMDIREEQTNKQVEKYTFTPPQPFKEYGYEVPVATLSQGKYQEFFDQDTIIQVGTVLMNRFTKQITHFVEYDTVYSEATLEPEVISRWLQPDPLADEREWLSPYNFVQNNPIIRVDPDGRLDEYYAIVNDELVYLGDDGQGNDVRLVVEGQEEVAQANINGANTTDEQRATLRAEGNSQVVTFNEGNIQTEFQAAHDRTRSRGLENSAFVTLDPATATVDAQAGPEGTATNINFSFKTFGSDGLWTDDGSKLIIGVAHGHPTVTEKGQRNAPGFSKTDAQTASGTTATNYSIDSYARGVGKAANIHQVKPGKRSGTNKIGTTQNTGNIGRRSFVGTAKKIKP